MAEQPHKLQESLQKEKVVTRGLIISPTGKGLRSDAAGDGSYLAPRGGRLHQGMDFLCTPGQKIVCPLNGARIVRMAFPYPDQSYHGVLLRNNRVELLLFYLKPNDDAFDKELSQGAVIGLAEDITQRYGDDRMQPHIHLQIDSADPALFLSDVTE